MPGCRLFRFLSVVFFCHALASCSRAEPSSSSKDAPMSNSINLNDITLECELVQLGALRVAYKIHNRSSRDVVVFNRIPSKDVDDTSRYAPANVYVDLDGDVLGVKLMILPLDLPPGMHLEYRPLPDVSLLKAGQTLSDDVVLAEPVRVRNPIHLQVMAAGLKNDPSMPNQHVAAIERAQATTLRFTVGLAAFAPSAKLMPVSEGFPEVFLPPLLEGAQSVLTKEFHLPRAIQVLDYAVSR